MRFLLVLLLLCSACVGGQGATRSSGTSASQAVRYVSLKKWAAHKGFSYRHDSVKNQALVTSKWATLLFVHNDRRCMVNGISVWLSDRLTDGPGTYFVSERDIKTHLEPLLYPAKGPKGKRVRKIAISAGHGGKDPGFIIKNEQEKKHTLLLARDLQTVLERAGFAVVMTREKDVFVDLEEQARKAAAAKADLFINLHYNAHPNVDAKGVEVFCLTTKGARSTNGGRIADGAAGNRTDNLNVLLAYQLQKALVRDLDLLDRGVRRAQFVVLKEATMPCVLVEAGFMSNPGDARKIFNAQQRRKMAQSIADGILAYKRLVER